MSVESDAFESAARALLAENKFSQSSFGFGNEDLTVNDTYADEFSDRSGPEHEQLPPTGPDSAEHSSKDIVDPSIALDDESELEETFESLSELAVKDSVAAFIASLQEPRHQTQPTGLEIAEMFQDYYLSVGNSSSASGIVHESQASELLTQPEQAKQKKRVLRYNEQLTAAQERAEAILTSQLYTKIYQTLIDAEYKRVLQVLCDKCTALLCHSDLLDLLQFNVTEGLRVHLIAIAEEFKSLENIYEPKAKVSALVGLQQRVVRVLESEGDADAEVPPKTQRHVSLDALLPALIFTVIHTDVRALACDLKFVRRFRRRDSWSGHENYSITNYEAAICALEAASLKSPEALPNGVDPSLFAPNLSNENNSQAVQSLVVPAETRARSTSQSSLTPSTNSLQSRFENIGSSFSNGYRSFITKLSQRGPNELETPTRNMSVASINYLKNSSEGVSGPQSLEATPPEGREVLRPSDRPLLYVEQRFLNADPDTLTLGDVRELLKQYQYLGSAVMKQA